jgi:hypothetical protein
MKHALITGLISLFALALFAPATQGATRLRQVQVEIASVGQMPPRPPGLLTLEFAFKNRRDNKRKFTPRQLTRIDFSEVPLTCTQTIGNYTYQAALTMPLDVRANLTNVPPPNGNKPKPGRYAFTFTYLFADPTGITGTLSSTIDKPNRGPRPRLPRSQGSLTIEWLQGHAYCSTEGLKSWSGLPLSGP